jgi:hypothetical protein
VLYYGPYKSDVPWPYLVGFRTTTVIFESWPTLTPAFTTPNHVLGSHLVIRWKDPAITPPPALPGFTDPRYSTLLPQSFESKMTGDVRISTLSTATGDRTATTSTASDYQKHTKTPPLSPSNRSSKRVIIGATVSITLGSVALALGFVYWLLRRKKHEEGSEIELSNRELVPVGCQVLYSDPTGSVVE